MSFEIIQASLRSGDSAALGQAAALLLQHRSNSSSRAAPRGGLEALVTCAEACIKVRRTQSCRVTNNVSKPARQPAAWRTKFGWRCAQTSAPHNSCALIMNRRAGRAPGHRESVPAMLLPRCAGVRRAAMRALGATIVTGGAGGAATHRQDPCRRCRGASTALKGSGGAKRALQLRCSQPRGGRAVSVRLRLLLPRGAGAATTRWAQRVPGQGSRRTSSQCAPCTRPASWWRSRRLP
jgi:hypothetical protein